jgi:hypothetical protein
VGERVRHGDELRRELIEELRRGLVGIYRDPAVGRMNVVSRYIPAVSAQRIAGDFYGAVVQPTGDVAIMVGDVAGHGPAAAALATRLRAMWRGLAIAGVSDSETVRALNETLLAEQRRIAEDTFTSDQEATALVAKLKQARLIITEHGELRFAHESIFTGWTVLREAWFASRTDSPDRIRWPEARRGGYGAASN